MKLSVFGSTGSIGKQALSLVPQLGCEVFSLCALKDVEGLMGQIRKFKPVYAAMGDMESGKALRAAVMSESLPTAVLDTEDAVRDLAVIKGADKVLNAIVGSAGLKASIETLRSGAQLALANKESMVAAGKIMRREAELSNTSILPVDSEHSAIWQSMWSSRGAAVAGIVLTASGGPLRGMKNLYRVSPEQALKHPTWSMGRKITIDSATLMNKALEVVEARWLFDVPGDLIRIVIHPQSIVHSAVMFSDGSVIAQLGLQDMRLPILAALTYPDRAQNPPDGMRLLDLTAIGRLDFENPDADVFPASKLGHKALALGGVAPAAMSAANELAVEAFLNGLIPFTMIAELSEDAMENCPKADATSLEEVLNADSWARTYVESRCAAWNSCHS